MRTRRMMKLPKSEHAEFQDNRKCLLCGNAFDSDQTDDRVCSACLAHAVGGAGVDQGRRRHLRIKVEKPVKLRDESREYDGQLTNLSYSGAAVNAVAPDFEDDQFLELETEEFGLLSGTVVRSSYDGFAISFDMGEEAKTQLVHGIAGYRSGAVDD